MSVEVFYIDFIFDLVFGVVEVCGLWLDGWLLVLNSYENCVW